MSASFPGFTIPTGAWLPEELIQLLPQINTRAEIHVTIAALYSQMAVGGSEPLSLSDFEALTGLSRSNVRRGLKLALDRGTLERLRQGQTFTYTIKLNPNPTMPNIGIVPVPGLGTIEQGVSKRSPLSSSDSLNLLKELRSAGAYLKTAQALLTKHSPDDIRRHLEEYAYALKIGMATGPGWLVLSIKEDWPTPLGFKKPGYVGEYICPDCFTYPCQCNEEGDPTE